MIETFDIENVVLLPTREGVFITTIKGRTWFIRYDNISLIEKTLIERINTDYSGLSNSCKEVTDLIKDWWITWQLDKEEVV